jgi:AraC family transcriptional regulator
MQVEIKEKPELRAAAVRHVGPYNQIGEAFGRLDAIVRPAGLLKPDTQMIAIYHDDPESTAADQLRSDAAVTVSSGDAVPERVERTACSAGRYACTTHDSARTKNSATPGRDSWANGCRRAAHRIGDARQL